MATFLKTALFALAIAAMGQAGIPDAAPISGDGFFGRERSVTERGCIPGRHDPMRVR